MTRVTNFGRKRTYVQAGFAEDPQPQPQADSGPEEPQPLGKDSNGPQQATEPNEPVKKKRKRIRTKMKDRDGYKDPQTESAEPKVDGGAVEKEGEGSGRPSSKPSKAKAKSKKAKEKRPKYVSPSELRRLKRIEEKLAVTTCFACREKGHAAKDCPTTLKEPGGADGKGKAKSVVGICYRCGSTRHNLARCKKAADPQNPLPHASCFVCSGKGHLASSCPKNKAKGVYPDGGCCKICGDTSHLAKDCDIRRGDVISQVAVGTGRDAGADEDDFHMLNRRTKEVERSEKQEETMKRLLDVKGDGTSSALGNTFASALVAPVKKKVVVF